MNEISFAVHHHHSLKGLLSFEIRNWFFLFNSFSPSLHFVLEFCLLTFLPIALNEYSTAYVSIEAKKVLLLVVYLFFCTSLEQQHPHLHVCCIVTEIGFQFSFQLCLLCISLFYGVRASQVHRYFLFTVIIFVIISIPAITVVVLLFSALFFSVVDTFILF